MPARISRTFGFKPELALSAMIIVVGAALVLSALPSITTKQWYVVGVVTIAIALHSLYRYWHFRRLVKRCIADNSICVVFRFPILPPVLMKYSALGSYYNTSTREDRSTHQTYGIAWEKDIDAGDYD